MLPRLGLSFSALRLGIRPNTIIRRSTRIGALATTSYLTPTFHRDGLHINLGCFEPKNVMHSSKITIRQLHTSRPVRRPSFNDPFGNRPPTFKFINISPVVKLFAVIGFISVLFFVLPFLFVVFFPLIIAFVAASQFRAFRRKKILEMVGVALKRSSMKLSNVTLKEMVGLYFRPQFQDAEALGIFKNIGGIYTQLGMQPPSSADFFTKGDFTHARRFLSFVEARVMESLEKDENGIRSQLFGPDYNFKREDVEFSSDSLKAFGRMFNNEVFSGFSFTMLSRDNNGVMKPAAIVSIVSTGSIFDGSSDPYNLHFSNDDIKHPMVIYVNVVNTFSLKTFFITDIGETGRRGHYTVRKDSSGNREFTYHN